MFVNLEQPALSRWLPSLIVAVVLASVAAGCNHRSQSGDAAADIEIPSDDAVRRLVDAAIEYDFRHRRLDTRTQAAWQILHAVAAYGRNVLVYDYDGNVVVAVDYLLGGGRLTGWDLRPGETLANGRQGVRAMLEPGTTTGQGHKDQWLGYMAISGCGLKPQHAVQVAGREFTIGDWLEQILRDVHEGTEHGWTLMVLATYVPPDYKWIAGDGTEWSVERVIALEASRDHNAAACGGTHSLGGMVVALNRYLAAGGRIKDDKGEYTSDGWGAAARKVDQCVALAREYQQRDGSLSAGYFRRPEHSPELANRLRTTGHTIEFLALALSDEELAKPWVTRAVAHMCDVLEATKTQNIECGALYHGMHGLVRYRERRFGRLDLASWAKEELAAARPSSDAAPAPPPGGGATNVLKHKDTQAR